MRNQYSKPVIRKVQALSAVTADSKSISGSFRIPV